MSSFSSQLWGLVVGAREGVRRNRPSAMNLVGGGPEFLHPAETPSMQNTPDPVVFLDAPSVKDERYLLRGPLRAGGRLV